MNIKAYINLLRPRQWLKNIMLLFPPFLAGSLFQEDMLCRGFFPLIAFCIASSSTYVLNDMVDRKNDSHHPQKKLRPVSSGEITLSTAFIIFIIFLIISIVMSYSVSTTFLLLVISYILVTTMYSLKLKEFPIIDIFCISAGFLIRLQAGGEAFGVVISEWLFLSVFLLALFLGTGKRLGEKYSLGTSAGIHRKSLQSYPDGFLDGIMFMTGAAVLVTYTMYVISRHSLIYTVPLCVYGLLRYIFIIKSGQDGDPTEVLVKDGPLFAVGLLWTVMVGWSIYK